MIGRRQIVKLGDGENCPTCWNVIMERVAHDPRWVPRPGRDWFKFWDKCPQCKRIQLYETQRVKEK